MDGSAIDHSVGIVPALFRTVRCINDAKYISVNEAPDLELERDA